MNDYGRRIVLDSDFDEVVDTLQLALLHEGLDVLVRLDVRDRLSHELGREFRRYVLIEAWSPELAFEALKRDLDAGVMLPTTFVAYELADGETVVVTRDPLWPVFDGAVWHEDKASLARIAELECTRVARVLDRVQHGESASVTKMPAA
jgi:uncharacterized protein (DUF302 family)